MTQASYYLLVLSTLFAIAAIVIFFVLDIPRCWNMIIGAPGTRSHVVKQHKKTGSKKEQNNLKERKGSEELAKKTFLGNGNEETILLSKHRVQQKMRKKVLSEEETALLNVKTGETLLLRSNIEKQGSKETEPLVLNTKKHFIKGQKQEKKGIESQETVRLCLENNLCDSGRSELTTQLDMDGVILIQDIVYMHEDTVAF